MGYGFIILDRRRPRNSHTALDIVDNLRSLFDIKFKCGERFYFTVPKAVLSVGSFPLITPKNQLLNEEHMIHLNRYYRPTYIELLLFAI
jgi:hypothetical protein